MSTVETTPRPLPVVSASGPLPVIQSEPQTGLVGDDSQDDLRVSDGVSGFRYNRLYGVWYCLRLILALPFIPLWPFFIAYEARDWSLARNYFGTLAYVLRTIVVHVRFGSFVRMLKYNIVIGPEAARAIIAKRRGACTRCAKCCKQYECIFLGRDEEAGEYICKVYKTSYWYYGTCGRYPLDQKDIDDHACPGFHFPPESDAA